MKTKIPPSIEMRQAKIVLSEMGLLEELNSIINSIPGIRGDIIRREWKTKLIVERVDPLVHILASYLSLSENDINRFFLSASKY